MDKKSLNRSSQPQSRATAVDCKKNTELSHKPWPRNNKKREGLGNAPKNEPYRKSGPSQRGRGQVDRRPRTRGSSEFSVGGTPSTRLEDDEEPEIGSVFVPGSKKQNLNHLLNFMYPTRGVPQHRGPQPRRNTQQHRGPYRHEHDLYLRAYCQFVVKEDGNYKANLLDPDVPIAWEQIEEIVVRGTGCSECPICLGPPVAGRVGLCGHLYCWACVLHYAAANDKQSPPCPVCTAPLHVKDMKPTRIVQWESPTEEVTMRLVRRLRGSTTVEAAPQRGQLTDTLNSILPLDRIGDAPYCKLFSTTKQQIHDIIHRERSEIENQILAEIDTTEIVFLEQALEMLKAKEENTIVNFDKPVVVEEDVPIVYEKHEINQNKMDWFDVNEEGAACIEIVQNQIDELNISDPVDSNLNPEAVAFVLEELSVEEFPLTECPPPESEQANDNVVTDVDKLNQAKYFYFYQADDGQQIFLNSLNVRILNASWGALAAAPQVIRGRVLHRETFSLSEQTRKHMPCTAHLPLYCAYDIVELDLQPPYVTDTALRNFAEELDRRARTRARHERDERRRERAYRRTVEGPPKPDLSSEVLFPPAPPLYSSPPLEPGPLSTFEQSSPSTSIGSPPSGLSFAKMASTIGTWRIRKAVELPPTVPVDEEVSAPRALVLSDAIEAALHAAPSPSGKKNKKSKQKLLFTTGIQRAA